MHGLYLVAGRASLVDLERLGHDVLFLYIPGSPAVDAGLLHVDELQVLAQDVGPAHAAALQVLERLLHEPVSLLLGLFAIGAMHGAARHYLGVLEKDLVLNGLNVAVGHSVPDTFSLFCLYALQISAVLAFCIFDLAYLERFWGLEADYHGIGIKLSKALKCDFTRSNVITAPSKPPAAFISSVANTTIPAFVCIAFST